MALSVSKSGFKSHLRRFLLLSVQTGVFVCFSVCPLFSITGWPCPVHCPRRTLGTRQLRGGNACYWLLGLCVFFRVPPVFNYGVAVSCSLPAAQIGDPPITRGHRVESLVPANFWIFRVVLWIFGAVFCVSPSLHQEVFFFLK